jgi:hypothetical protein
VRVNGDKELIEALKKFPGKLSGQVLRRAGQKAATPVAKAARKLVKPISPTIAKSIGTKVKVYKSGHLFVAVGPKAEPPKSRKVVEHPVTEEKVRRVHDPRFTAHLVHGGTKPHKIVIKKTDPNRTLNHPGVSEFPFLTKALEQEKALGDQIYLQELRDGIAKIAAELNAGT